jgi:hypothetical protein
VCGTASVTAETSEVDAGLVRGGLARRARSLVREITKNIEGTPKAMKDAWTPVRTGVRRVTPATLPPLSEMEDEMTQHEQQGTDKPVEREVVVTRGGGSGTAIAIVAIIAVIALVLVVLMTRGGDPAPDDGGGLELPAIEVPDGADGDDGGDDGQ